MENKKRDENLLLVLSSRRKINAKNQLKSVLLEMLEIFGYKFVNDTIDECVMIYNEFVDLTSSESKSVSSE